MIKLVKTVTVRDDFTLRRVSGLGIVVAVMMVGMAGTCLGLRSGEEEVKEMVREYEGEDEGGGLGVHGSDVPSSIHAEYISYNGESWWSYRTVVPLDCSLLALTNHVIALENSANATLNITTPPHPPYHPHTVTVVVNYTSFTPTSVPSISYSTLPRPNCSIVAWNVMDPLVALGMSGKIVTHDEELLTLGLMLGGGGMLLTIVCLVGLNRNMKMRVQVKRMEEKALERHIEERVESALGTGTHCETDLSEDSHYHHPHHLHNPYGEGSKDITVTIDGEDYNLYSCMTLDVESEVEESARYRSAGPVVNDADFTGLNRLKEADPIQDGWALLKTYTLKNSSTFSVYSRKKKDALNEYLTIGELHVAAEVFWMVNNDLTFRKSWDHYCKELKVVEEYDGERDCAVYWRVAFPMPFTNRDYVFYREHRVEEGVFMTVAKAAPHKARPATRDVRVTDFTNDTLLTTSPHGPDWCRYVCHYFDDPKAHIPTSLLNWVTSTAIPGYLENLFKACAKYDLDKNEKLQEFRKVFKGEK